MQNNEQYWERRALIRLTDAEKTSLIYEKKIRKAYRKAERDIEQEIEKIYSSYAKDVGLSKSQLKMLLNAKETSDIWKKLKAKGYDSYIKNNYKARISRLEAIKAQLYEKSKDVGKVEQKNLKQALRKVFKDSYSKTNYDICKETNIDAFSSLDDKTVDTVINSKWHGDNYSTRVWNNTDVLAAKLDDVMTRSVMTGASMSKAMREIRETFNTHSYYAERLIRTETNRAHNEAEALAYDNMGVKEYVFVATLDNRTSLMCQEHDQKRYKLSERKVGVNYPPLHPNCRSTVRAFIDEETERLMQRRARNPFTGETEIVGNMSYQQWMDKHKEDGTWKEATRDKSNRLNEEAIVKNIKENLIPAAKKDVVTSRQEIHRVGTQLYNTRKEKLQSEGRYGPSRVTISNEKILELVDKFAGTGKVGYNKKGEWDKTETILLNDEVVGICVNNLTGEEIETTVFKIHYGKKGVHIVPDYPSKKRS